MAQTPQKMGSRAMAQTLKKGIPEPWLKLNFVLHIFTWNIYDNASHSLSKAQIDLKKVFYSIFVVRTKIWILKYGFLSFFGAKWLELKSKTQKINYQWFLAHFLWFLSLFQIPDVKHEFQLVKLKVRKNGIIKAKTQILKIFPVLF